MAECSNVQVQLWDAFIWLPIKLELTCSHLKEQCEEQCVN